MPDGAATDVVDAWIKAQAYRIYTWGTVSRLADGGEMGAAGSVNKVFWSELDIALHETALGLLGTEAEVESRGPTAICSRFPARSTPAPTRSSATSSPSASSVYRARRAWRMNFELSQDQRDFAAALKAC